MSGTLWRLALLVVLVPGLLTAEKCDDDDSGSPSGGGGGGVVTPINWNSTTTLGGLGTAGGYDTPLLWNDPNQANAIGAFIPSNDVVTYSSPTVYISGNFDPIRTQTNELRVTNKEDELENLINNYRLNQGGGGFNNNFGGGFGFGGFGGGIGGAVGGVALNRDVVLREIARAHCKHFAIFHNGIMFANSLPNPEGDDINAGGVPPAGLIAKGGGTATTAIALILAGQNYDTGTAAMAYFQQNNANALLDPSYYRYGVGYWEGGPEGFYWCVILASQF